MPDEERVSELVRRMFTLPNRPDATPEPIRRGTGYQATHTLVMAPESHDDISTRGTACEVQVATVAGHLFNELEHDIAYKQLGHAATPAETRLLASVERACKLADHLVEQLLAERVRGKTDASPISDPAELRLALERLVGRPLKGDFARLFKMLDTVIDPLTPAALARLGRANDILTRGSDEARTLGVVPDDVISYVIGILPEYLAEISLIVAHWRGPRTPLRIAIESAVGRAQQIDQTGDGHDAAEP